jgi:two-component system LytT family response regulator
MTETIHIRTRCLIVDDEPPAREVLKRYIEQVPLLELTGECANAIEAMTRLQQQAVDLIFLDIRMPQLNGTDFLKTLKSAPRIILTTAFAEYALEGYELDVVDYLLKPVRFDRFLKAVNKAFPSRGHDAAPKILPPVEEKKEISFVYFRADRKMMKVLLREILYIESMKDYVKVVTTEGTIITKQSISSVEGMLPEKQFVRTHRSFIVSLQKINSFTPELIELGRASVPIGKLYRNGVLKMLEQI